MEVYVLLVDDHPIVSKGKMVSVDEGSVIREVSKMAKDLVACRQTSIPTGADSP